jgi:hypothetical protein
MKICPSHWEALRQAIDQRGLTPLVSADGAELAQRQADELVQGRSAKTYDPLAAAMWAIFNNGIEAGGAYMLGTKSNGEPYCPLCELEQNSPTPAMDWIEAAAEEQLGEARALGLAPKPH